MAKFGTKITDAQFRLARMFEKGGLTTISQAVKAFERRNNEQIEEWKKQLTLLQEKENQPEKKIAEMVITHSDNDGSYNAETIVKCPHCGEGYRFEAPYFLEVGETFTQFCDGEDGCGEEFTIVVK